jgi:NADH-quinone oxidoreductase subunit F
VTQPRKRRAPAAEPAAADGNLQILYKELDEPGLNTLKVYERRGGYEMLRKALKMEPQEVLDEMLASNVRGRGGAGFAMGKKMSFIPKGQMDKYLVCNADESEPGTFKDRELMQKNPHQLIEGMIIAAFAIGANKSFIFIRGEYAHQADVLDAALAEARGKGYVGERILGSDHTLDLVVHRGAGAYICGEETALLDSLEGKRGNPRLKPPFPAIQGLYRGPTLINNVETLMNVPYVLRVGGAEYAKVGTETSTGTKVVSISGHVQRPGNYEVVLGTPSREIIFDLAGGPPEGRKVKAWFPGGSSAPVLTGSDEHLDLPYDFDSLAKAGSMLGSGAIIVIDDSSSIVDVALKTAKFYRHESCGKCTPCREGTNWTVKMLERVKSGEATPMDLDIMASVCEQIIGNCLCVLGDAMAMPIGSMIVHFRAEFEEYIEAARERNGLGMGIPQVNRGRNAGLGPMREPTGVDPSAAVV